MFLAAPSSLELTAEQLIAQNLVPAESRNVVPSSIRSLGVIAEPRLDPAAGAIPWYPFASPAGSPRDLDHQFAEIFAAEQAQQGIGESLDAAFDDIVAHRNAAVCAPRG